MELAKAKQDLTETEKSIRKIQQTTRDVARELGSLQAEGIGVDRYRIYADYLQGLKDKIECEDERLVEIGKAVREKHKAVEVERIKKETLEWIRQNEYAKHSRMIDREQQKGADELVSLNRGTGKF
jgi:flagellar export protein FliJ